MMDAVASHAPSESPLSHESLRQQLFEAMGPGIGIACTGVDGDPRLLWPEEKETVRQAVPTRQREFAAGRAAAREAMTQLGWPPSAVPSATDRSPIWPDGLVGSIAHTRRACVAIVGRQGQERAMGIDIESDNPIAPELWSTICTPEEFSFLETLPPSKRGRCVTRFFCAKEAFYKWQYPQTGRMLEFGDVQVTFNRHHAGFGVQVPSLRKVAAIQYGHLLSFNGLVLAWLIGAPS